MATDVDLHVHYWGLNSMFWAHRKVFVKEIYALMESKEYKGIYQSGNQVVIRVEVLGTIVSVDDREKLTIYGDDGTGIISCCYWKENLSPIDPYCLGQLVTVQGKLTIFRDQRQLAVSSIVLEGNPNAEMLFWLDVVKLNKEVYSTPFVLPDMASDDGSSSCTEQLMQFLSIHTQESKQNGFSFRDLCCKSKVQEIAQASLGSTLNDQIIDNNRCSSAICKVVRTMLRQLEMKGEIYYKDASMDSYEIITYDHHLKPAIIKAIKDISKGSLHQGAHIARITDTLHSTQSLCRVGPDKILDSLKKLIGDSEIYQQSNQVYCIV